MLEFLYQTAFGRCVLKLLTRPGLSKAVGKYMDSRLSRWIIPRFIRSNGINMEDYLEEDYTCFNDFFCRRIRPELRPVDREEGHLIAPCDGLLSVYPIQESLVIPVKGSRYSIPDLLRDDSLAARYENGTCLVFRLCVHHYHRYIYGDSGVKEGNTFIPGVLHTVRPVALREVPVFKENSREYTVIHSQNFGNIVQMEVGAMLVGKIDNYHQEKEVHRGEEKGRFLYGGSTIILLLEPDAAEVKEDFFRATEQGNETEIKMGQMIGIKKRDSRS